MVCTDSDGYKYDYDLFDMECFCKMGETLMVMIVKEDDKGEHYLIGLNLSKLIK